MTICNICVRTIVGWLPSCCFDSCCFQGRRTLVALPFIKASVNGQPTKRMRSVMHRIRSSSKLPTQDIYGGYSLDSTQAWIILIRLLLFLFNQEKMIIQAMIKVVNFMTISKHFKAHFMHSGYIWIETSELIKNMAFKCSYSDSICKDSTGYILWCVFLFVFAVFACIFCFFWTVSVHICICKKITYK